MNSLVTPIKPFPGCTCWVALGLSHHSLAGQAGLVSRLAVSSLTFPGSSFFLTLSGESIFFTSPPLHSLETSGWELGRGSELKQQVPRALQRAPN